MFNSWRTVYVTLFGVSFIVHGICRNLSTLSWWISVHRLFLALPSMHGHSVATLCSPMDHVAHQVPLSTSFPGKNAREGLSLPPPGDLPHPGTEPKSPGSSVLPVCSLPQSHLGCPTFWLDLHNYSLPFLSNKTNFIDLVRRPIFIFTNSIVYFSGLKLASYLYFILTFCLYFIIIHSFKISFRRNTGH